MLDEEQRVEAKRDPDRTVRQFVIPLAHDHIRPSDLLLDAPIRQAGMMQEYCFNKLIRRRIVTRKYFARVLAQPRGRALLITNLPLLGCFLHAKADIPQFITSLIIYLLVTIYRLISPESYTFSWKCREEAAAGGRLGRK